MQILRTTLTKVL